MEHLCACLKGVTVSRFILVSTDGHACCPPDLWATYIERRYHHLLPGLAKENETHVAIMPRVMRYPPDVLEALDDERIIRSGGRRGFWDIDTRIREMNREGIAAETVYNGGPDIVSMWTTMGNHAAPVEVQDAGRRAWHRWTAECLSDPEGRLLLVGDSGQCFDMHVALAELRWLKEHGFFGVFIPGNVPHPDLPPLYDKYFDPFWSACEDLGLHIAIHAGYGNEQGTLNPTLEKLASLANEESGSGIDQFVSNSKDSFFAFDPLPRKAVWELMLGGVFDRHPKLRMLMTEIRADWVPPTLARLDNWFERSEVPAKRKPSEYWKEHFVAGLSFMKRSEIEMRNQIGIRQIGFGRDYPHPEGTWPKTHDHLRALLHGVTEDEARLMLGENMIRVFGLDRPKLAAIAERINAPGPKTYWTRPSMIAWLLPLIPVVAISSRPKTSTSSSSTDLSQPNCRPWSPAASTQHRQTTNSEPDNPNDAEAGVGNFGLMWRSPCMLIAEVWRGRVVHRRLSL